MASKPASQSTPASDEAQAPVARFVSDNAYLIVYHAGEKIAAFVEGAFETDAPAVVEALRDCPFCNEA